MQEEEIDDVGAETDIAKSYIDIDDNYRLANSGRNWQIQRKSIAKTGKQVGKTIYTSFSHHLSLKSALNTMAHIKLSKEKFNTLQGLVVANEKVLSELSKALSPTYTVIEE